MCHGKGNTSDIFNMQADFVASMQTTTDHCMIIFRGMQLTQKLEFLGCFRSEHMFCYSNLTHVEFVQCGTC